MPVPQTKFGELFTTEMFVKKIKFALSVWVGLMNKQKHCQS